MTSVAEIENLVEGYRSWLRDRTTIKSVHKDWVEITTPFLDRHNDFIQVYARSDGIKIDLHDDGETLRDLSLSGCSLDSPKRKSILQTTLNGFGVHETEGVLRTSANTSNFAFRKHALLQAILAINDMFYLSTSNVRSLFKEDVASWLDLNDVRYVANIQLAGRSGYQHYFDFAVPKSKKAPERIIRAITNPNKDAALNFITAWTDTIDQRPADSLAIAILNDNERAIAEGVLDALKRYDIKPLLWSGRELQIIDIAA